MELDPLNFADKMLWVCWSDIGVVNAAFSNDWLLVNGGGWNLIGKEVCPAKCGGTGGTGGIVETGTLRGGDKIWRWLDVALWTCGVELKVVKDEDSSKSDIKLRSFSSISVAFALPFPFFTWLGESSTSWRGWPSWLRHLKTMIQQWRWMTCCYCHRHGIIDLYNYRQRECLQPNHDDQ